MARNSAKLTFASAVYNPVALKQLDPSQVRKEYSRLRSIARKRIERIKASEWGTENIVARLPEIATIKTLSDAQIRARTSELARFLQGKTSSVSGMNAARRQAVKTLGARYPELKGKVTVKNWREFAEFMEYSRELHQNRMYDSERVAEFFAENEGKENLLEEFDKWLEENSKNPGKLRAGEKTSSGVYRDYA